MLFETIYHSTLSRIPNKREIGGRAESNLNKAHFAPTASASDSSAPSRDPTIPAEDQRF